MPKSVSQLNPAEDPQESDLLYVGQIARTPRDRKIGIAALARAFLHRALAHPILSWVPGGDPLRVMARKGVGDANDQVGLIDLQTIYKDARTEIIRSAITGTPAALTFDMGAHPGNVELFLTGADAAPHLVLTNDISVGHTLKIRSAGVAEAVIVEYPAGTALYHLQPAQTMVLARDATGYMISVESDAVLPMRASFLGNESVKLTDIGGQWWRTTLGELASKLLALAGAVSDPVAGDEVIISRSGTQYRMPMAKLLTTTDAPTEILFTGLDQVLSGATRVGAAADQQESFVLRVVRGPDHAIQFAELELVWATDSIHSDGNGWVVPRNGVLSPTLIRALEAVWGVAVPEGLWPFGQLFGTSHFNSNTGSSLGNACDVSVYQSSAIGGDANARYSLVDWPNDASTIRWGRIYLRIPAKRS